MMFDDAGRIWSRQTNHDYQEEEDHDAGADDDDDSEDYFCLPHRTTVLG